MSIESIQIPNYSRKQETFNSLSHFLGVVIALAILVFAVILKVRATINVFYFIGLVVFGLSALAVYTISGIYHYLDRDNKLKKIFRVIDHCTIYLLIAGTYTPICFVVMDIHVVGLIMLIVEWVGAVIGIILKGFFFDKKVARVISFFLYIIMGWLALYSGGFLYIPSMSFLFILLGGIAYTIGSILYAIGHKNTNFHSIFHIFVLVSTVLQTIGVFLLY